MISLRAEKITIKEIGTIMNKSERQVKNYLYRVNRPKASETKAAQLGYKIPASVQPLVPRVTVLTNFGYTSSEISEDLSVPIASIRKLIQFLKTTNQITKRV